MQTMLPRLLSTVFMFLSLSGVALGQAGGGGGGVGGGGGGGGVGGGGGAGGGAGGFPPAAGVEIDPQGVLRVMQPNPQVTAMQLQAARQSLPPQLARPSKLRKVSLNRLERAVAKQVDSGKMPTPEMVALAGINKLEYVFFYPETGDIVLAGPAEGFGRDSTGRIVGVDSQRPCLLLDDVIVALRAYGPKAKKSGMIQVSIDPTEEGLQRYHQALKQLGGNLRSANDIPLIVNTLQQALGLNEVTIAGVPATTHFAHVLTEADYRMKLIGIGLEPTPVRMRNYISELTPSMASSNALTRWYFVPDYQALMVSEDGHGMQLVGNGVKLVGEDERVDGATGQRKASGRGMNGASKAFTTDFTRHFQDIARVSPGYGQLRKLVDLSIAAAYIQDQDLYSKCNWDLGLFLQEDKLPVEVLPPPRQVNTAINAVMKGSRLITPIGGGVQIQAKQALKAENVQKDSKGAVNAARAATSVDGLAEGQWWWD